MQPTRPGFYWAKIKHVSKINNINHKWQVVEIDEHFNCLGYLLLKLSDFEWKLERLVAPDEGIFTPPPAGYQRP